MIDHVAEAERCLRKQGDIASSSAEASAHALVDIAHTLRLLLVEVRANNAARTEAISGALNKALGGVSQMFGPVQIVPPSFLQNAAESVDTDDDDAPPHIDPNAVCSCSHKASAHLQYDYQCLDGHCTCAAFELPKETTDVDR